MKIVRTIVFAAMVACAYSVSAQQPDSKQNHAATPEVPDKVKLAIRDEQVAAAPYQSQLQAIAAQYQQAMQNDENYKKALAEIQKHNNAILSLIETVKKDSKVDPAMALDLKDWTWKKPQNQ